MNNKIFNSVGVIAILFATLFFFSSSTSESPVDSEKRASVATENSNDNFMLPQLVRPPKINKDFLFAGEAIPINPDTRERLERELMVNSYYHSSTLMALKYSTRYFPTMERILKEEGVPDDFKYLAVAESGLTFATSPAGAKGIWQFMKGASSDFNLEVTLEVDERYHVEKSTYAACKYLKQLYKIYGNWLDAAAAYNVGPGNLSRLMKSQGESSYFDMNLNAETSRYVFRIAALKEIMSSPETYGYILEEDDYYPAPDDLVDVKVKSTILSLSDFAHEQGTTYRMLKYYNPWLLSDKLTVRSKEYVIQVPKEVKE